MSRATLTSINKPHTDNIFTEDDTRKKTVEWRTKPLPKGLHYVYETKNKGGCGKVIGEMTIVGWRKFESVSEIPHETILKGRISARQLDIYSKDRPLYANVIVNAKRYSEPKELYAYLNYRKYHKCLKLNCFAPEDWCWGCENNPIVLFPPQSYCFVESL